MVRARRRCLVVPGSDPVGRVPAPWVHPGTGREVGRGFGGVATRPRWMGQGPVWTWRGSVRHDEGMRAGNDRSGDGKCAGLGSWLRRARARMVSNEPEVWVCSDAARMSRLAARRVVAVVRARPDAVIGLTTGASPLGLYEELVRIGRGRPGLFRRVRWVELDEWGGLAPGEEGSNERYLWDRLLGPLGVSRRRYAGWNGMTDTPEAECRRMAR